MAMVLKHAVRVRYSTTQPSNGMTCFINLNEGEARTAGPWNLQGSGPEPVPRVSDLHSRLVRGLRGSTAGTRLLSSRPQERTRVIPQLRVLARLHKPRHV